MNTDLGKKFNNQEFIAIVDSDENSGKEAQNTNTGDEAEKNCDDTLLMMTPTTLQNLVPLVAKTPLHQVITSKYFIPKSC